MNNQNQKPCDCPFCTHQRQQIDKRLQTSLSNINNQLEKSHKENEEYEKTVKTCENREREEYWG
jgi:hypothetical protein